LTWLSAASIVCNRGLRVGSAVRLMLDSDENALAWPAAVKTDVSAPAKVMAPLLLASDTTPLLMEESVAAPPVSVSLPKRTVLVKPVLVKSWSSMSLPSVVDRVRPAFDEELLKLASHRWNPAHR